MCKRENPAVRPDPRAVFRWDFPSRGTEHRVPEDRHHLLARRFSLEVSLPFVEAVIWETLLTHTLLLGMGYI